MARSQHPPPTTLLQAAGNTRPRRRRCPLKGCDQRFSPSHIWARYCSPACAQEARRHSLWLAAQQYRASHNGKEKRKEQLRRRRQRIKEEQQRQQEQAAKQPDPTPREGHHCKKTPGFFPCHRPGCYECFPPPGAGVLKKFCCPLCRQALRRVLRRERAWERRLQDARLQTSHTSRLSRPP